MGATKKSRTPLQITLVVIAVIMGFLICGYCFSHILNAPSAQSIDEQFANAVSSLNKTCPRMINETTRLDSVSYGANRTETSHYTALDIRGGHADALAIHNALKATFSESYRNDPGLKFGRDNGLTMIYQYYDADGNHITDVEVGPQDLVH